MDGGYGDGRREEDGEEHDAHLLEEEEVEPRLKYQRMGGSVPSLLSTDSASCIAVAERAIALGTQNGAVHILDFQGNQIKQFAAHSAIVNDLSFDIRGEYVGSCSDDGSVVINSLFSDESLKYEYRRPMISIALDPEYSRQSSRRFVTGGLVGQLFLHMKYWLRYNKQVLHKGESPIRAIRWRTSFIAWANDDGVNVYDMASNQQMMFIERPQGSPHLKLLLPHLEWQDDTLLVIGWGTCIKIVAIRNTSCTPNGFQKIYSASCAKHVDIVASFQTNYYISGIAPYADSLVVLAYLPDEGFNEKDFNSTTPSWQGTAQRPEVHIVTWKNEELTTDALPVRDYEHCRAKDYALAHSPFSGSSYAGGQWAAGDEPFYYIVSPKDIVIARPRDTEDHISWLLQHGSHAKALAAFESGKGQTELLDEVGASYLDHLIVERKYAEAAALCPKLLSGSVSAWERWVLNFYHLRQLPILVPYMPTENPQLSITSYEVALVALATNPYFHKLLLSTLKAWPTKLYSPHPIINAIEPLLNTSSMTDLLKEALAELYTIADDCERALALYADMLKPEVFDFIERYSLQDAIRDKVVQLMILDWKRSVQLFVYNRDIIPPPEVVSQLLGTNKNCDKRFFLHIYLHSLFEVDPQAGKEFHDLQVELCAEYEPKMLFTFLRSSRHYKLEKAYEICVQKDLLREQVFVLGRMGNAKKAIAVIINKLEDIEEAVEFISMQNDDELWEELIKQCFRKPDMIGMLLEHTVGNLDPLYIVKKVPNGIEIPRLRDRLVKVVTDYRTETSLRQGCNDILKTDSVNLMVKYFKEAQRAISLGNEEGDTGGEKDLAEPDPAINRLSSFKTMRVKHKARGAGRRCCLCFDPFSIQNVSIAVFFCFHAYHLSCLMDAASASDKTANDASASDDDKDSSNSDDDNDTQSDTLRCVLCTTASVGA